MAWEYINVTLGQFSGLPAELLPHLNNLGSVGWEVCGFTVTSNVAGLSMPTMTALLKRERPDLPAPDDVSAGWRPDPLRRFLHRWWDGIRWTESVNDGTNHAVDFPDPRLPGR